jgi:hypothetical protein
VDLTGGTLMAKNLSVQTPATRILYYPTPAPAPLAVQTPQELAAQRQELALRYAQWLTRYQAMQERDRRTRRILIRVLATVAAVVVAALVWCGWQLYQAVTHMSFQPLADLGPIALGLLVGIALVGGGSCVTIVRHDH